MTLDRTHLCSIDIKKTTRDRIVKLKIHPRQAHDEVIIKGLKLLEEKKE